MLTLVSRYCLRLAGAEIASSTKDGNDENLINPTAVAIFRTFLNVSLVRVIDAEQKRPPTLHERPR
ncbi:hypothetical protein EV13_0288 [Prochlorococcus sp. MIT 0702]|uniref:hypothetical protein n=1 Tax=Prochlorococcus sp. MIT 0703 TaxID=1499504 RepID=UPI0005338270|nr:hypothetical protein EV12_1284 [Prochlorococcus sp. MIT 0701]KGG30412.1 hypothetical protein EV13_0288 [Prochlorococcus sp. MIT 0702]KGG36538.1 hypothetical protein EV14_0271 [Prochlorococcus sp. MIT 0703]